MPTIRRGSRGATSHRLTKASHRRAGARASQGIQKSCVSPPGTPAAPPPPTGQGDAQGEHDHDGQDGHDGPAEAQFDALAQPGPPVSPAQGGPVHQHQQPGKGKGGLGMQGRGGPGHQSHGPEGNPSAQMGQGQGGGCHADRGDQAVVFNMPKPEQGAAGGQQGQEIAPFFSAIPAQKRGDLPRRHQEQDPGKHAPQGYGVFRRESPIFKKSRQGVRQQRVQRLLPHIRDRSARWRWCAERPCRGRRRGGCALGRARRRGRRRAG